MSQHHYEGTQDGKAVTVIMGYDRPLDYVFCTVVDATGEIIYCNLDDEDAGLHQQSVEYYRGVLAEARIVVPESLFIESAKDQLGKVGNRAVTHRIVRTAALGYDHLSHGRSESERRAVVEHDPTLAKAPGSSRRSGHPSYVLRTPSGSK